MGNIKRITKLVDTMKHKIDIKIISSEKTEYNVHVNL